EGQDPNPEQTPAYANVSLNGGNMAITNTGNEPNFNIKNVNVSSLFSTAEADKTNANYILANEAYNLGIYVRGTQNSDDVTFAAGEEEYYYINGSSMTINTYMCMLDTPVDFHIANGVITWTNSLYASKIRLKIYGAYDLEYDYATGQEAEYNTRNWYLHAYDNVAGTTTLHNGIEIEEIELNTSGADGINRYVLGSKFIKGGYAVSAQAIGNGLGVVDSNLTDADHSVYAVKLDTTEVGLNKGNFVWPLVQDATSYYVEIYGQKKDGSDAGQTQVPVGTFHYASNIVTKEINGVRHAVYDLDGSYNDETVNYYIRVSPRNLSITQNVGYLYGDFAKSAAYGRLNAPELTEINDRGELWWDTSKISVSHIERFVLYSNYSDREDNTVTIETECGDQNYAVLTPDEEYASQAFTVQVRVMSSVDNMLNSAKSDGFMVLKMQEPDLRIENGNVAWNNQPSNSLGSEVVDSNLSITYTKGGSPTALFEGTVKATDPHVFMFYQEVEDNKYSSMVADGTYPATNYNVKVSFVGTVFDSSDIEGSEGSEGEEDENIDKYYYLASIEKQATVNKLTKPSLSSSSVQEGDAVVSYARWLQNESTTEYAVYVYATYGAGNKNHVSSRYDTMTKGTYFKKETVEGRDYVFFNIDAILNDGGDISAVATEENLKLFIYAQAVGTINSKTLDAGARLYVNSNFSDSLEISVPPTPIITSYADGKLTWETVVESGYDIEGVISYEAQVNEDLLNNYWLITSNKTQEGEGGFVTNDAVNASVRQSEVTHRELTYTLLNEINGVKYYTIKVSDNIKLYPEQQQTQTYYYLNQVGTNYAIKLRACVHSEDAGVVEGNYKSAWTEEYKIQNMLLFADGDGTTLNPYIISDEAQLLRMGNYPSRHFKLGAENITVSDWSMIFATKENEFTGTLDGNGYTINIANISLHEVGASDIGFIGYNAGTISNLQINYIDVAVVSNVTNIGGIVVWNGGTLQQVSVKGYLAVARADNNNGSIVLGGIATHNGYSITVSNVTNTYNGTITYATVSAQLTTQTKNGNTSEVGGIAAKNSGTISYSGVLENAYLKANWVGGITVTNNATGKITHSFNKGVCEVYDKNTASEFSTVYLGGIVSNNLGDIDYSYSIAEFRLIREGSTTYYVGGLVGVNKTATTIALSNNYTVFRLHKDNAVTSANASAEIGAVVGRCNNNASNTSNKWRVYYYVEDTIAGYTIKPIGSAGANVTTGDLVSKAAADMKNDTFASTLGAASFSYYNYINSGYPVLNFEFNLMFAANDYYYVVEVDIKEAYYRLPGSQDRVVVPNTSLSDGYEFKEQNPDDVQYAYTIVLEYTVTYAGEVTLTGEVTVDSAYCYYSVEKPEGDTRNFAVNASTLGEYVIRVYLSGDFVTFGDIQTSPYCTTGVDDRYGAFVEFTWKLVLGD
ncbi:MAG: hypothetical protein J6V40_02355, partial [Clostridia bacterium]|nr:hypothetical protein [Clostridia bacterium]